MIVIGFVCLGVFQVWLVRRSEVRMRYDRERDYHRLQIYLHDQLYSKISRERDLLLERVNQDWSDFQILHAWVEHLEWRVIEFRRDLESLKH